ncbi:gp37 family Mu-like prophage protein [Trabulsiella guamensis ATCC 49490]|uniref:Gp37 family Mu-like prophage protein n=1 Tax=Trabulsiella guamensis ATCC 49490 TaxID=1005994 RepID=A0A084Z9V4_9ENTR|nr:hypothetical protein [Trabulsiella guamensis]KFB94248.1 gp37 family Mu-like prophage protein [Trabulsiella guamensis ATCC 49490]
MSEQRPSLVTLGSTVSAADNIIAWLRPEIEGDTPARVQSVERHIGQFSTADEVKRHLSAGNGCVRLAALRIRNITSRHGMTGLVTWGAYIMVTDSWGYPRDVRCEVLVALLARRISSRDAPQAMKAERLAENINAENIYSGSLDSLGITMWVVTWDQEFRLDDDIDLATLPDFLRLGAVMGQPVSDNPDIINVREGQTDETTD